MNGEILMGDIQKDYRTGAAIRADYPQEKRYSNRNLSAKGR
jgi:hypothetical protein